MKNKILGIVGSNNKKSFTNLLVDALFEEIKMLDKRFQTKIICLSDYKIDYCIGCITCFLNGFCPLDKDDDFKIIRRELLESDIIFFASPVYIHNVPGKMKTFFDRISSYTHLLSYAGKIGFTLTATDNNGEDYVKDYLTKIQKVLGIKNLDNYIFKNINNNLEQFVQTNANKTLKCLEDNYGYTDRSLESYFNYLKDCYHGKINSSLQQEYFELSYWNRPWIKECKSFQEFASKNGKIQGFKNNGGVEFDNQ
ncbi:MAG: flavodoxin family protein [Tissierella sp.]|nr:flavodoxin family protein [Tissierella sp.]